MSEVTGTVVAYDPADALGWIELGGGERIRFGLTALHAFHGPPGIGTPVRVLGIAAGFRGVRKATRVVPADHVEPPPLNPAAILRALRLDATLGREDWPATHAALVAAYQVTDDLARIDRDLCFAVAADVPDDGVRALLERWLGEPVDAGHPITHAADVFVIRDEHGPTERQGSGPQLFGLKGDTGTLYVVRTWAEREAIPGVDRIDIGTCSHPDTQAALGGLFRNDGAQPSFVAHAPGCPLCQENLREVIGDSGFSDDWRALVR